MSRSIWRVAFSICGERCGAASAFCGASRRRGGQKGAAGRRRALCSYGAPRPLLPGELYARVTGRLELLSNVRNRTKPMQKQALSSSLQAASSVLHAASFARLWSRLLGTISTAKYAPPRKCAASSMPLPPTQTFRAITMGIRQSMSR